MSTTKTLLVTLAAAASLFALSAPASAQEATPWPELMHRMADTDKDGMVTRKEFLDHMARMWDDRHGKMMKSDSSMKVGMMNRTQFMSFVKALQDNPGRIGG